MVIFTDVKLLSYILSFAIADNCLGNIIPVDNLYGNIK